MMTETTPTSEPAPEAAGGQGAEMAQQALDWMFSLPREEQQQVRDEIRAAVASGADYVEALVAAYEEATGGAPTGEEESPAPQGDPGTERLQAAIYG